MLPITPTAPITPKDIITCCEHVCPFGSNSPRPCARNSCIIFPAKAILDGRHTLGMQN